MALTQLKTGAIADDAVTTDKLANAINTERTANTAKVSLDADSVTGAKIADDAINSEHYTDGSIDTAHIAADQITGALIADDAVGAEHIETLDANISFADNARIVMGDAGTSDSHMRWDATNLHLASAGKVRLSCGGLQVNNLAGTETIIDSAENGAVELYHDNSKTAWTHGSGFNIKGGNTSDQTELIITGNEGQAASILMSADDGDDNADHWRMYSNADNSFTLTNYTAGSYETNIKAVGNGAVELYYDNSKKLETYSNGVKAANNGNIKLASDSGKFYMGAGDDAELFHDGTNLTLNGDGTNSTFLRAKSGENSIKLIPDGAVQIYHNNVKTAQTEAGGVWNVRGPTDGNATLMLTANDGGDNGDSWRWLAEGETNTKKITLTNNPDGNWETSFTATGNAGVELYYNNSKKIETDTSGVTASGRVLINNSDGVNVYGSISMTETSTYGWVKSYSGKGLYLVPTSNGVYLDAGNTSWNSGSDERTKTGLTPITDALTKIEGCRSVIGRYKTDEETTERSFLIAQDFQTHFPVAVGKNKTLPDDENLSLRYQDVIPLLLAGIKELSAEVKTLKTKVAALEAK